MKLIDADDLLNLPMFGGHALKDAVRYGHRTPVQRDWSYSTMPMHEVRSLLMDSPAVVWRNDAELVAATFPPRTDYHDYYQCTNCGVVIDVANAIFQRMGIYKHRFCLNCGAAFSVVDVTDDEADDGQDTEVTS